MDEGTGFGAPVYSGLLLDHTISLFDINKIYTFRVWAINQ